MSFVWLKAVPWSTIIANAPSIVDGARKLVSLVRSPSETERSDDPLRSAAGDPDSEVAALHAHIEQLEHEQRRSAELLRELAESNAQMAQALDYLRKRVRLNGWIAALALAGLVLLAGWVLLR